ncbi:ExoP-related protein [Deinococcus aerius]|uniref:ExoP-related protein n=1 Tax=Deinococcus aerius TaxID=200253 RepID=A0A2I9DU51_9DEIO|nr:tyrosine-protein kinase family protein [Deinococcus aerius]GBF06227.1 ExoP-related protein [Deinococcus aerius]
MPYRPPTQLQNDDVDVPRLALPLRRHALPLLSAALLAGALTYAVTARQARQYETMSSVVSVGGNADGALGEGLVAAPPLPPGTLQQALRDGEVVDDIARRVLASDLPPNRARALAQAVEGQRRSNTFSLVRVTTPEGTRSDLYEVWGQAGDPASARVLVNASVDALLAWDQERARERVVLARASLQKQLAELNRNEPPPTASDLRWDTYQSTQARLYQALTRVSLLENAAVGTLQVVARAPEPAAPVATSPLGRAGLAALLTLFGASAVILLLEAWRRRVYDAHSLRDLGLPLLGQLPRPAGRGGPGALQDGALQDSLGFLRVNVLSQLSAEGPRRLVFASPQDGAGSGSVVTALATSLAAAGQRVLVVDTQPHPGAGAALEGGVQPLADHVDRLSLPGTDPLQARTLVGSRAPAYDLTLIAAPPLLRRSDALLWAQGAAGIVLVLGPGANRVNEVEQVLQSAELAKVRVLGVVLNELQLEDEAQQAAGSPRPLPDRNLRAGEADRTLT